MVSDKQCTKTQSSSFEKEDVVLLKNEGTARCLWKLAKVLQLLQGRVGAVRAARVEVLNTDK